MIEVEKTSTKRGALQKIKTEEYIECEDGTHFLAFLL